MTAVWCDLYINDEFDRKVKVKGPFEDFADLQEAVWKGRKAALLHCGSADLDVYPAETTVPPPSTVPFFRSDSAFPSGTTSFVVVAPAERRSHLSMAPPPMKKTKTDFTSPAAIPETSRSKRLELCESLVKSEFRCFINGTPVDSLVQSLNDSLVECETSDMEVVASVLGIQNYLNATPAHPDLNVDFKTNLVKMKESEYQASDEFKTTFLNLKEGTSGAIDNLSTSSYGPFYTSGQRIPNFGDSVYHKRAKHDVTSAVATMDLEMKSDKVDSTNPTSVDWDCLRQAQDRVKIRMYLHGFVGLALAFAVTNRTAWCCIAKRSIGENPQNQASIWCYRIEHPAVAQLWMGVTRRAAQEPLFFLTEDGPHICYSLAKIGATPWACRVKWLASSQSNVYAVTMPSKNKSVLCVKADQTAITYAVKVVKNDEAYDREVDALRQIAKVDPDLYAVGHVRHSAEPEFMGSNGREWQLGEIDARTLTAQELTYWWWLLRNASCGVGGVIFMKYGLRWDGQNRHEVHEVCDGVLTSLRMAHSANVLHCDIRPSNVLLFRCGWRLVDFGLSCHANSGGNYDLESSVGAQAKGAGPRVQSFLSRAEAFWWEIGDDYEMLFRMLGCLAET